MTKLKNRHLAVRLKKLRKRRKVTQKVLARFLGISRGTYSTYECGSRVPPMEQLVHLASRLGVSTDYLLGISDYELPIESGIKYGILRKLREVDRDDLQPYTPRMDQFPHVAEAGQEPGCQSSI